MLFVSAELQELSAPSAQEGPFQQMEEVLLCYYETLYIDGCEVMRKFEELGSSALILRHLFEVGYCCLGSSQWASKVSCFFLIKKEPQELLWHGD